VANFDEILSSINGNVANNMRKISEISGAFRVGGWIAKWGSWQIFKHSLSDKCNVLRGIAVTTEARASICRHNESSVCVVQIEGQSILEVEGHESTLKATDTLTIKPGNGFKLNPRTEGSEFILIVIPPAHYLDEMLNANSLEAALGVCLTEG